MLRRTHGRPVGRRASRNLRCGGRRKPGLQTSWRTVRNENSGCGSGRDRRLFRRAAIAGGPRRHVSGASAPRGLAHETRVVEFEAASATSIGRRRRSCPTTEDLAEPFDLIILSCKAYDLDGAITSFAGAVGPNTAILPLLNGMRHLDVLADRFGAQRVLGGLAMISATIDADGGIAHLNDLHALAFGELDGSRSQRIETVASALMGAGFDARLS